jgi:hypothetical protein
MTTLHSTYEAYQARYALSGLDETSFDALHIHASELVDSCCLSGYDETDEDILAILSDATCDQIAAWVETGDGNNLAGYARSTEMTVGDLTIKGQPAMRSPRMVQTLRRAGLTTPYGE